MQHLRSIGFTVGILGLVATYVLLVFFPAFPRSIVGWLAIFVLGLPAIVAIEYVGNRFFSSRILAERSSAIRVGLAVVGLSAIGLAAALIARLVSTAISS
jgi:hypothetical protein